MTQQTINVGVEADDGTGDPLRSAFIKVNDNFTELYASAGTSGVSGVSGYSGYSGLSGTSGYSGISGTSGRSGFSGYSGFRGFDAWSKVTTNTTAVVGDLIIADTSSGPFTVTLPASPTMGDYVILVDGNDWTANNLTVSRNGNTIEGQTDNLVLDIKGVLVYVIYDGLTWQVSATVGAKGESGYSGVAGEYSASGISGTSGTPGTSGVSGVSGYSGTSGVSGYSGMSGVSGYSGAGTSGFSGFSGEPGTSGVIGSSGFSGYSGTGIVPPNLVAESISLDQWNLKFNVVVDTAGVVTYNCAEGQIFYHTSNTTGNITANFTNLNLNSQNVSSVTIVLNQGTTPYIANNVQVEGNAQTIFWQGATEPTGTANCKDVITFALLNNSGSYIVLGQLASFG